MLDLKLARKLKEAGLAWTPKEGDWFATRLSPTWWLNGKKTGGEKLYILTGQPTDSGYYGWSTVDTEPFCELFTHDGKRQEENWRYLAENFLWVPGIEQLVQEITRRAKSLSIVYQDAGNDPEAVSGYRSSYITTEPGSEDELSGEFFASTIEEALAMALLSLLQKSGPGE
ncbi:MAG: hypothetical protein K6T65_14840 [Peptococcaceae bacterium]|nr:hypothetical protein [Peptococcaceae bacterium]